MEDSFNAECPECCEVLFTVFEEAEKFLKGEIKMKYKIVWIENTDSTGKELKDFMETLPNPKQTGGDCYGGTEIECYDTFEAKDIEEAKKKIEELFNAVEVFAVFDDKGNRAFTEEDL